MGPTPLATVLSDLYQRSACADFQLALNTYSFDLSTFWSASTLPNRTYNKPKSRNWDKWVLPQVRLSWATYSTYRRVLSSSWLDTYSFDLSTFPSTSTQPNRTYNRTKSRNWDKWVLPHERLSWATYSTYRHVLTSSWILILTALTWVPSYTEKNGWSKLEVQNFESQTDPLDYQIVLP